MLLIRNFISLSNKEFKFTHMNILSLHTVIVYTPVYKTQIFLQILSQSLGASYIAFKSREIDNQTPIFWTSCIWLFNGEIITKGSNGVIRVDVKIAHCKNDVLYIFRNFTRNTSWTEHAYTAWFNIIITFSTCLVGSF